MQSCCHVTVFKQKRHVEILSDASKTLQPSSTFRNTLEREGREGRDGGKQAGEGREQLLFIMCISSHDKCASVVL